MLAQDLAERLVERSDDALHVAAGGAKRQLRAFAGDDRPIRQPHQLAAEANVNQRRTGAVVLRLKLPQVGLEDVIGAQIRRFAADRDDALAVLERLDQQRLHHQRRRIRPIGAGVIVELERRALQRDAARAEARGGDRRLDDELPLDRRKIGGEGALWGQGIELRRIPGAGNLAAGQRRYRRKGERPLEYRTTRHHLASKPFC